MKHKFKVGSRVYVKHDGELHFLTIKTVSTHKGKIAYGTESGWWFYEDEVQWGLVA